MQSNALTHRETDREYRLSDQSANSAPDSLPSFLIPLLFVPIISLACLVQATVNRQISNSCRYPSFFCVCSQARGPISVRLKPQLLPQLHASCWLPSSACNRSFAFSFLYLQPPHPAKAGCLRRTPVIGGPGAATAWDIERAWTLKRWVLVENS